MGIRVDDYSTETGLRVRVASTDTGTAVQLTTEEWRELVAGMSNGLYLEFAQEPKVPFTHWPEGQQIPPPGGGNGPGPVS